jgi:hypothetical protein
MRARGVEPLLLTVSEARLILTEEMGEAATDTTGSCGPQGVHTPNPFEKENSVGGIRLRPSAGRSPKTNVFAECGISSN